MFDARAHCRLWGLACAGLILDLWSKSWAFSNLGPSEVREVIPSILSFRRSINPGALFGMGKGLVPVFIVASIAALGFVVYLFACSAAHRKSLHLALAFVLAGSLGNLYDRVFVIADRVSVVGRAPMIGKIVEDDASKDFIRIGDAPDGANPIRLPRADTRVSRVGVVRDFLKIEPRIAGYDVWPWVFNVADSLLVVGVTVLMINLWIERRTCRGGGDSAARGVPES